MYPNGCCCCPCSSFSLLLLLGNTTSCMDLSHQRFMIVLCCGELLLLLLDDATPCHSLKATSRSLSMGSLSSISRQSSSRPDCSSCKASAMILLFEIDSSHW